MRSFPWDSIVTGIEDGLPILDRTYHAADLREVYKTFFSNGVFIDVDEAFQVTAVADELSVLVAPGKCNIEGTIGWDGSGRKLVLQAASSSADRIDTVVLRWNANNDIRDIDLYVKTGTVQEIPVRPQLTRNDTVYELGLCDIYVARGTSTVTQQRITDTRLDKERCGVVSPLLDVDTTSFYLQLQAQTAKAVELANEALEGTIAGELQSQIDSINSDGWVTENRISNGSIGEEKIKEGAVSQSRLSEFLSGLLTKLNKLKPIKSQSNELYWYQYEDSGRKYLGIYGDENGSTANYIGRTCLNQEPIAIESVLRSFSINGGGYQDIAVNAPSKPGYCYKAIVGVNQTVTAQVVPYITRPDTLGLFNASNIKWSGDIRIYLLYVRAYS